MNRGQVTIFVIIGLAILLIVGLVLLNTGDDSPPSIASQQEAALVTSMVQQCLAQTGQESIRELASRGGVYSMTQLKDVSTVDTQVVALPAQKIPLWHEIHSCTQNSVGCLADNRPPLCERNERNCPLRQSVGDRSIQEGIELLVESKLEDCLGNFTTLPNVVVTAQDDPQVDVSIRADDISLLLTYPLTVETQEGVTDLEQYSTSVDVNLPRIYRLAYDIQMEERSHAFIEEVFINLLAVYQSVDGPIPPFRDIQFTGSPKTWVARQVQQDIADGVLPFVDFIQIVNAQNYVPLEVSDLGNYTPYANGIYEYMAISLGNDSYPLNVRMEHVDDPVLVEINGGKPLLKPRRMPDTGILRLLGMNVYDYRFRYVVSFPVVVHIEDPAAFNGQGLEFSFGLEANVYNNRPLNVSETYVSLDLTEPGLDLGDPSQRTNHTFTIRILDRYNGTPIPDAAITYACGAEYAIGATDENGVWSGRMPYCALGGHILAHAEGYASTGIALNNEQESGASNHELKLWRVKQKEARVFKLTSLDVGNITLGGNRGSYRSNLTMNDSLVLMVNRIKESPYDEEVPLVNIFQLGGTSPGAAANAGFADAQAQLESLMQQGLINLSQSDYEQLLQDIERVRTENENSTQQSVTDSFMIEVTPGDYAVDGTLMYVGLIQIPEQRASNYVLPAQNFSSLPTGGVLLTGTDAFQLTPEQVYGSGMITFYVLEQKIPQTWDEFGQMQEISSYQSYGRKEAAKPEVS